jgi:hypothetical protein
MERLRSTPNGGVLCGRQLNGLLLNGPHGGENSDHDPGKFNSRREALLQPTRKRRRLRQSSWLYLYSVQLTFDLCGLPAVGTEMDAVDNRQKVLRSSDRPRGSLEPLVAASSSITARRPRPATSPQSELGIPPHQNRESSIPRSKHASAGLPWKAVRIASDQDPTPSDLTRRSSVGHHCRQRPARNLSPSPTERPAPLFESNPRALDAIQ